MKPKTSFETFNRRQHDLLSSVLVLSFSPGGVSAVATIPNRSVGGLSVGGTKSLSLSANVSTGDMFERRTLSVVTHHYLRSSWERLVIVPISRHLGKYKEFFDAS
jgi:hypothetical protein